MTKPYENVQTVYFNPDVANEPPLIDGPLGIFLGYYRYVCDFTP